VTEKLGSEVDVIFPVRTPAVQHEVMVAQFDTAAKDTEPAGQEQDQTSGLIGAGESLWTARVNPKSSVQRGPRHRPGRGHLGAVLVRPRQRPGHRPAGRRVNAPMHDGK
jgi:hypothetical protein